MQRGFSLVELSIVLVILGLLTGGILAGQSLIRAAELRSITTQRDKYVAALGTFRDKYFAIPGDMANAQSFWGVAHATPATCQTTVGTGTQTCNGDGSGFVDNPSAQYEFFRAWQHLANAGLIEGNYSGVSGPNTTYEFVPNTNCPVSRLGSGTCWELVGRPNAVGSSVMFDSNYGNVLIVGSQITGQQPLNPILKPEEAWNIDTKLDDGKPGMGSVLTGKATATYSGGCASSDVPSTAVYNLSTTTVTCNIMFKTGL